MTEITRQVVKTFRNLDLEALCVVYRIGDREVKALAFKEAIRRLKAIVKGKTG